MLIETEHLLIEAESITSIHFWPKRTDHTPDKIPIDFQTGEWATISTRNCRSAIPADEAREIAAKWKKYLKAEEEEMHRPRRRRLSIQNPNPETIN